MEEDAYDITLIGLERDLNALDVNAIQASVDITELMEAEGLSDTGAGNYTANVAFNLGNNAVTVRNNFSIRLIITEAEQ